MSDRIRFITHEGKQILLVDLSNCSATQADEICHMVPPFVTARPKGSVLILGDFTGAKLDKKAFTTLKEAAVFDRPHIKCSAWVGTESLPKVFYQNVKSFFSPSDCFSIVCRSCSTNFANTNFSSPAPKGIQRKRFQQATTSMRQ